MLRVITLALLLSVVSANKFQCTPYLAPTIPNSTVPVCLLELNCGFCIGPQLCLPFNSCFQDAHQVFTDYQCETFFFPTCKSLVYQRILAPVCRSLLGMIGGWYSIPKHNFSKFTWLAYLTFYAGVTLVYYYWRNNWWLLLLVFGFCFPLQFLIFFLGDKFLPVKTNSYSRL